MRKRDKITKLAKFFPRLARGHGRACDNARSECNDRACGPAIHRAQSPEALDRALQKHLQAPREVAEEWLESRLLGRPAELALRNVPAGPAGFQRLRKQTPGGGGTTPSGAVVVRRRRRKLATAVAMA